MPPFLNYLYHLFYAGPSPPSTRKFSIDAALLPQDLTFRPAGKLCVAQPAHAGSGKPAAPECASSHWRNASIAGVSCFDLSRVNQ
ncbi:hypothetical protein FB599_0726 [Herbaspirillum sp. SJZ130]|nr:hypothetical protein FB599_0726 [Herbaspirillum sp. SJZ130]TQK15314.1 hypothetical protein FB598_0664 [Herbaspirillum sp. SJZ106]